VQADSIGSRHSFSEAVAKLRHEQIAIVSEHVVVVKGHVLAAVGCFAFSVDASARLGLIRSSVSIDFYQSWNREAKIKGG
jgi:hypothetical protein